ncbi:MAG TPA: LysR substrate-binding domain-containing protein [Limnobacter sp.]|uniref:LysR substrate-binding domain-containing protein n=1 Tax=Limnobacter sp. TaxID=2003368 RepID=UPI002ED871F9
MPSRLPKYSASKLPSVPELIAFEAIARHKSFSKAADELSITQSAISHRIQQLESRLGAILFQRQSTQTELTAAGLMLLPGVQSVLVGMQQVVNTVQSNAVQRVRLSLPPMMGSHLVSHFLTAFQRENPKIDLEISITGTYVNLKGGEADVGVRMGTADDWPGLVKSRFMGVCLVAVCSPAYLKANPWVAEPAEMLKATLLRQAIYKWCDWFAAQGVVCEEPQRGPFYSDVYLLLQACELAQGIALVPRALVEQKLDDGKLVQVTDFGWNTGKQFYVCASPQALEQAQVRRLYDWLAAQVASL